MSLFVFRDGYRIVATASGGRVIHIRTGDALDLSHLEVQLLARATAGGVDARDPRVKPLVRKLAGLGLLVPAAEAAPKSTSGSPGTGVESEGTSAEEKKPSAEDAVPLFRGDLKLVRRPGRDLMDVKDPVSGKSFMLYDFEVSLARMLDGRRTNAEVIEAGQRLGIPVSFESLRQFIRQLERYGFLAPPGSPRPERQEGTTWPKRQRWDDAIRTLFQSGMRLNRQGRYAEAAGYFEAILEQDPTNEEAQEMLAQMLRQPALPEAVAAPPPPPPSIAPVAAPIQLARMGAESARTQSPPAPSPVLPPARGQRQPPVSSPAAGKQQPPVSSAAAEQPPVEPPSAADDVRPLNPAPTSPEPSRPAAPAQHAPPAPSRTGLAEAKGRTRRWRLGAYVGGGLAALVLALAAGWHLRGRGSPPRFAVVPSPAPAPVVPNPNLPPPQPATAVAATVEAVPPDAGAAEIAAESKAAPPPSPQAAEAAAETPATAAAKDREWISVSVSRRGRVTMAQVRAPLRGAVAWSAAPQHPVERGSEVGRIGSRKLVAPKAGLLMPKLPDQGWASAGELLADIVYHEAYLQALVSGARPRPDWSCQVADEATGSRADCKLITIAPRGSGHFVTATTEPLWFDSCAEPRLRLAPPR
ncbi:MAG: tetratricopeptide repeat protein [Myxococcales bacterium]|nr:tetratricopeptide repeat protein [Myxococcales bacterium]